ncbi:hypothetical protein ACJJIE_09915 [Microbulbifer sp. TRSA001]|uniref:hypothetical protein n=1 Tax=unclassified Microbulbifer TaxID=2619833 RepID=UPI0024AD4817|nr:hypothetical protein [Microbulbifer sp. VAAF005]WHI48020.1 hypothetical protein P0078_06450 [Microbulbifer sp. VAAF005]
MKDWTLINSDKFGPISKIVAVFQVGPPLKDLAIPCIKIKILENKSGKFIGTPNIAVMGQDDHPQWISGFGETPEAALIDTLEEFYNTAKKVSEEDFVYSKSDDFL